MKIELAVKHLGHVPSFKNSKMIARGRLITDPKKQKWMEACIRSFESQLFCIAQIGGGGTLTAPPAPSLIASSLPQDDSRQWIPRLEIADREVEKGLEGATIIIESI